MRSVCGVVRVCARNSYSFTSKISKVLAGPSSLRAPISTRLELTGRGASSELCVFTSLRDSIGTHSNIASCEHTLQAYFSDIPCLRISVHGTINHGRLIPPCFTHEAAHDRAANLPIRPQRRAARTRSRRRRCHALERRHEGRSRNGIRRYTKTLFTLAKSESLMAVSPYLTPPQAADGSSTSTFPTHIPSRRPPFAS
jgi:hypothetical protein